MNEIKESLSDIKALVEGLKANEEKIIYSKLLDVIENLTDKVEELKVNQEAIEENIQFMDDDLSGIQEELFEEVSFEDLNSFEDEYKEVKCKNCNKPIFIEESALSENDIIPCPYCGSNIIDDKN